MTLYEFNLLDKNDRYQTTWDLGTHIDSIIDNKKRINLYAIETFFVEAHYNAESNEIVEFSSFIHGHSLDKYCGDINL